MTKVVFETATLADSLKKANRIAPSAKGYEFGTSGGIVLEVRTGANQVVVRSTNLELWYVEEVNALEVEGASVEWRLPDRLADVIAMLPLGSGKIVTLDDRDGGNIMEFRSGTMSGTMRLIPMSGYPIWDAFDESNTVVIEGLGDKIAQISWALHDQEEPLTGVYADGQYLVASNRRCAARVPMSIPILSDQPLSAPMKLLGSVIRTSGDIRIGLLPTQIAIAPDDSTQIRCVTFGTRYPSISKALVTSYETSLSVDKEHLVESVQRLDKAVKSKTSLLRVMVGGGQINMAIRGVEKDEAFEDTITLGRGGDHLPVMLTFAPSVFLDGIGRGPDDSVEIHYNVSTQDGNIPIYATGGGGYEAWFMQRASV